jgi:hypothetical protein
MSPSLLLVAHDCMTDEEVVEELCALTYYWGKEFRHAKEDLKEVENRLHFIAQGRLAVMERFILNSSSEPGIIVQSEEEKKHCTIDSKVIQKSKENHRKVRKSQCAVS